MGWDKNRVEKGFETYHYSLLQEPIKRGLAAGHSVHILKKHLMDAGWKDDVVEKALKRATGKKIGPDPLDILTKQLDKVNKQLKKTKK